MAGVVEKTNKPLYQKHGEGQAAGMNVIWG